MIQLLVVLLNLFFELTNLVQRVFIANHLFELRQGKLRKWVFVKERASRVEQNRMILRNDRPQSLV
jgi:hypothetical protein